MAISSVLSGIAGGASVQIVIQAVDQYSKEFKNAQKQAEKTGAGFAEFGDVIKKATIPALTGLVVAMGAFAVSASKAAAQEEPIRRGFEDLAKGSEQFLSALNAATYGTVNNFELMGNANKALLLGIDQDALPEMFKSAAIVGQAAGRTTTEAIQDITIGIGRQSAMILDNLGIIVKADSAYEKFAERIGTTADKLTAEQKKIAFTEAALKGLEERAKSLGGELDKNLTTELQELGATFDNLKVQIGTEFNKTLEDSTSIINDLIGTLSLWNRLMEEQQENQEKTDTSIFGLIDSFSGLLQPMRDVLRVGSEIENELATQDASWKKVDESISSVNVRGQEFTNTTKITSDALQGLDSEINNLDESLTDMKDRLSEVDRELSKLQGMKFAGETDTEKEILAQETALKKLRLAAFDLDEGSSAFENNKLKQQELRDEIEKLKLSAEINYDAVRQSADLQMQGVSDSYSGVITDTQGWIDKLVETKTKHFELENEIDVLKAKIEETKESRTQLSQQFDTIKSSVHTTTEEMDGLKNKIEELRENAKIPINFTITTTGSIPTMFSDSIKSSKKVNDFILQPGGKLIETSPQDTIFGMKNTNGLGGSVVVNIGTLQGLDSDVIAEALQTRLQMLINTS